MATRLSPFRATLGLGALLLAVTVAGAAETLSRDESGRLFLHNHTPRDYRAGDRLWSVAQAADGPMFFGGDALVLEYDGVAWRQWPVPGGAVRGLASGENGRVFVASESDFGCLEPDENGGRRYRSLRAVAGLAPDRVLGALHVAANGRDVYFSTAQALFHWDDRRLTRMPLPGTAVTPTLHLVAGAVYARSAAAGVFRAEGTRLVAVSAAPELLGGAGPLLSAARRGHLIAGTSAGDFFEIDAGGQRRRLDWTVPAPTREMGIIGGITLRDGRHALVAPTGILLVDAAGQSWQRIDQSRGLANETVHAIGEDREGNLWMATDYGAARVDLGTPFTLFFRRDGIERSNFALFCRHGGDFFAASDRLVVRLVPGTPARALSARFEIAATLPDPITALASHSAGLLIGTERALYFLPANADVPVRISDGAVRAIALPAGEPDRAIAIRNGSVFLVERDVAGAWRIAELSSGLSASATAVVAGAPGRIWFTLERQGVARLERGANGIWEEARLTTPQLPAEIGADASLVLVARSGDDPLLSTSHGLWRYEANEGTFMPLAPPRPLAGVRLDPVVAARNGAVWTTLDSPGSRLHRLLAGVELNAVGSAPVLIARDVTERLGFGGARRIFWERTAAGETLWAAGAEGLLRVDLARLQQKPALPPVLLRSVQSGTTPLPLRAAAPRLEYSRHALRFNFALPVYSAGREFEYQWRLIGFDDDWSEWSARTETTYTNLSGGPFTFEVRARSLDGQLAPAARFAFAVRPPWFRSLLVYPAAALIVALAVWLFLRWRLGQAERERRRLERIVDERTAELKVAKENADAASEAKGAFLANMSHELRTPLNGVIGYAQVLIKDRELSAKNRERLRIVQTSGEHLLRMINEVLDFSKIEAGKMELANTPFHLPQLLRDIAAAISPRFEQKQLEFVFDPATELPELVLGDPLKLRQAIDNLLSNAVKFTPAGTVRFQARVAGADTVEFSIADTGVGIAAPDLARLFQPFQQARAGRPPEPGTGLGLAISQRMVALMGGRLEVESQPGYGSRFFFTLPLPAIGGEKTSRTTGSIIAGYHGRRRRLLVVDDIATNRHVLRDLLTPLGFDVFMAVNGTDALAMAQELPLDAVFVDLQIRGIDALELTRRLRERFGRANLKLIAMSASVLSVDRERALAAGCDDFLPKPFREDDLLARLGLALQLEWIGDTERSAARPDSRAPFERAGSQLPSTVVQELLAFARRGEIAQLRRRLEEIPGDPFVDALEGMAKTYRMERICELLERQLAQTQLSP